MLVETALRVRFDRSMNLARALGSSPGMRTSAASRLTCSPLPTATPTSAADVLIPGEDPRALARFIDLSKRTRRAVSTNIAISVGITMLLVCVVLLGWEIKLWSGVALHEASALIVILNGMWVTGTGPQRMTTIADLARDLRNDLVEALRVAIGASDKDSSATA
jgi:hypothetical protein